MYRLQLTLRKKFKKKQTQKSDGNMLNTQRITPNLKRWDYSDIPDGGWHL